MPDLGRFDPTSWFVNVAMSLFYGAVALALAIAIIQYYIYWIIGITLAVILLGLVVRLAMWWWGRPW